MSESAQRLSDDLKQKYPDIEWHSIAGFRNVLVHDYLGIDFDVVWRVVQNNVPELKRTASVMLNKMEKNE